MFLKPVLCEPKKLLKAVRTGNLKNSVYKFSYVWTIVSLVYTSEIVSSFSMSLYLVRFVFFLWENLVEFVNKLDTVIDKINKKKVMCQRK